jgi:solute carrier family 25 oxoglutarate transporter 11
VKDWIAPKDRVGPPPLWEKLFAGMSAGAIGAFVGSPADIVMVRMQADGKLPPEQRINYRGAFDGLARITKEEGVGALWRVRWIHYRDSIGD